MNSIFVSGFESGNFSIFKKRRRQNSRRKNGHRQEYSMVKINKIFSKDGKVLSEAPKTSNTTKKETTKKEMSKK